MKTNKREKLLSVRISYELYNCIAKLNKLQAVRGNKFTISDTINLLLEKSKNEIKTLENDKKLFS